MLVLLGSMDVCLNFMQQPMARFRRLRHRHKIISTTRYRLNAKASARRAGLVLGLPNKEFNGEGFQLHPMCTVESQSLAFAT